MCLGGDGGADEARKAREKAEDEAARRERRIAKGQERIEDKFAQFDGGYFRDYKNSVKDYMLPQVADQYDSAYGDLVTALAGRGMLDSTFGATSTAKLNTAYDDEKARVGNEATNLAQELRGRVETEKSNLMALNSATADPSAINAQARGAAATLKTPPSPTQVIGGVFDSILSPFLNYQVAQQNSPAPRSSTGSPVASGAGSSRIVR